MEMRANRQSVNSTQTTNYETISDDRNSQQQNTYATLNKTIQPSRLNRMLIIFFIINTCIGIIAIAGVIYLVINKLDTDTKINSIVSELKALQDGMYIVTDFIYICLCILDAVATITYS